MLSLQNRMQYKKRMNIVVVLLLSTVVMFVGCERHGDVWEQMDLAERLMDTSPDSALAILNNLEPASVRGEETQARYALLKSMALDKNYIDTTTFDVLQPAIDYYIENGTPDERLRTYYYQGRIYQNRGDEDSAMYSFMTASDLRQQVTDTLLLAHTFVAEGTLYYKEYKISDYIYKNLEAARLYGAIGKDIFEIKSYADALEGYILRDDKSAADSLMSICMSLAQKNPDNERGH